MEKLVEKIAKLITWIAKDGYLHFSVSFILLLTLKIFLPLWACVIITAVAGAYKEFLYDYLLHEGEISVHDLIMDAAGILYAVIILILV